jgi:hypothetical protein
LYTVGQCEPIRETLTPEKERQVFGHWIQLNILKMFLDDEQQSLEMQAITDVFRNQSKSVIKPKLQDVRGLFACYHFCSWSMSAKVMML